MSELSIVAIGGGRPDGLAAPLLKRGLDLAQPETKPNVLVVPTAKPTQEAHDKTIATTSELYQKRLKVPYRVLHDFDQLPSLETATEHFEWADVIYVAGGDTLQMMERFRTIGIDQLIAKRAFEGMVLSGISAGAILPFKWGHSDSHKYRLAHEEDEWDYARADGLGLVKAAITPHYNTHPQGRSRAKAFLEMFGDESIEYGIGISNASAVEIIGNTLTAISNRKEETGIDIVSRDGESVETTTMDPGETFDISVFTNR